MKKLFALMMALMLALAGVSMAGAEDAAAAPASSGTINLAVALNSEAIAALAGAADETAAKMIDAIVDLVNNLSIAMTSDGKDAELVIKVKDQAVAGVGVLKDEDKMLLVSDLFPNYALAVDQSMMGGAAEGTTGGFTMPQISMDADQMAALSAPITQLTEQMQAKIGEPEAVEVNLLDTDFTVKVPINMTTKEAALMGLNMAKEIVSQEAFTSILEQMKAQGMKVDFSAETIDEKIKEITDKKDEDLPALDAAVYTNEAGDSLTAILLAKEDELISISAGTISGGFVTEVSVPGKVYFLLAGAEDGNGTIMNLQFSPQEGMLIDIDGLFIANEEGFAATFLVKMNDTELGTIALTGEPNGVLTGGWTTEGKTVVGVQDLQDQKNEGAQGFMKDIQTGTMMLMGKIMQVYPDFATIMQSMMPQTQPQQ